MHTVDLSALSKGHRRVYSIHERTRMSRRSGKCLLMRQTVAARAPEGHVVNSQEREIISGIFKRLEQAASQPRDPETERFISDKIRSQPYAPYAMAQLIYVQEEAIKSLNQQA